MGWMVAEGQLVEVLGYLGTRRALSAAAPPDPRNDEIASLEARLAPALLAADAATLARLPAESQLVQHRSFAQAALAAIPFRSPYRDLRLLLKAMVLWETDQNAARLAIGRLPVDGPFESLAAPLRTLLVSGAERLHRWAALHAAQQTVALDLLGCPPVVAPARVSLANPRWPSRNAQPRWLCDAEVCTRCGTDFSTSRRAERQAQALARIAVRQLFLGQTTQAVATADAATQLASPLLALAVLKTIGRRGAVHSADVDGPPMK